VNAPGKVPRGVIDRSICKESLSAIYRATRPRAKRRHGLAFFKLVGACLCGLDHASAVSDGIQTQFTRVITPTLQEHLRSPQKQRWNESKERSHGGVFYAIRPVRLQAKSPSPNVTDKSGIRWICCDYGYF